MKKRLLSNRVRNAILMAILLQSIIFGIGLVITGTLQPTVLIRLWSPRWLKRIPFYPVT